MPDKIKSANGVTGTILRVGFSEWVFRVYDQNHNFVDYDFLHSDMTVTISDPDAYFYVDESGRTKLDYGPETLGK